VTDIARYSVLILSIFMLVGGILGFVKAQSKASLIAGVASAILLAICFGVSLSNTSSGLIAAFVIACALDVVFAKRLVKTKKFMPSGMLLIVNGITQVIVLIALVTGGGANPPG
jgi:uncharacterized membrane protein (UPF0136 family)